MIATTSATKTTWAIDPTHSEIGFKIRHLMITNVNGKFGSFDGSLTTEGDDFKTALVNFHIATDSVDTGNADRDTHLKAADFFDATQFPDIRFVSTGVSAKGDDEYDVNGDLTIKGITKPVTLHAEFAGLAKDLWGNEKGGFSISTKISRKEWGLTWNANLETGGVVLSDDVKINGEIQLVKKA